MPRDLLDVGERDDAGNWPMVIKVRGLPDLPAGGRYLLYLTKTGRHVPPLPADTAPGLNSGRVGAVVPHRSAR